MSISKDYPEAPFLEFLVFNIPTAIYTLLAKMELIFYEEEYNYYLRNGTGPILNKQEYCLMKRLCQLNLLLAFATFLLAETMPSQDYWAREYPFASLTLLIPILAWYVNSKLLTARDNAGKIQDKFERIFWFCSFVIPCLRLIQMPYEQETIPRTLNFLKIITGFHLNLYLIDQFVIVSKYRMSQDSFL